MKQSRLLRNAVLLTALVVVWTILHGPVVASAADDPVLSRCDSRL
jgi:hypothetical protein